MTYTVTSSNDIERSVIRDAYTTNGMYENGSFPFDAPTATLDTSEKKKEFYLSRFKGDAVFETQGRVNEDGSPIEGKTNTTLFSNIARTYITVTEDPSTVIEYVSGYLNEGEFKFDLSIHLNNSAGSKGYLHDGDYWDAIAEHLVGLGASKLCINVWTGTGFDFLSMMKTAIGNATRMTHLEDKQRNVYSAGSVDTDVTYSLS